MIRNVVKMCVCSQRCDVGGEIMRAVYSPFTLFIFSDFYSDPIITEF